MRNHIHQVYVVPDIRAECGYGIREILPCLKHPRFNEEKISVEYMEAATSKKIVKYHDQIVRFGRNRFPKTLADLETLLPPKMQSLFADGELEFYRDSVGGNFTRAQMKERVKALVYRPFPVIDDDTLVEVQNKDYQARLGSRPSVETLCTPRRR